MEIAVSMGRRALPTRSPVVVRLLTVAGAIVFSGSAHADDCQLMRLQIGQDNGIISQARAACAAVLDKPGSACPAEYQGIINNKTAEIQWLQQKLATCGLAGGSGSFTPSTPAGKLGAAAGILGALGSLSGALGGGNSANEPEAPSPPSQYTPVPSGPSVLDLPPPSSGMYTQPSAAVSAAPNPDLPATNPWATTAAADLPPDNPWGDNKPKTAWRCDCSTIVAECVGSVTLTGHWLQISSTSQQCSKVDFDVNGDPQSSTIFNGSSSEEWLGSKPAKEISVRRCAVCSDAGPGNQ